MILNESQVVTEDEEDTESTDDKLKALYQGLPIRGGEICRIKIGANVETNIPLDFSTPYGCSKGSADQYVRDWARVYGLNTVVFRHSSIYGGRQFSSLDQGWIGWFCKKALEQSNILSAGKEIIPFTISGTGSLASLAKA